MSKKENKERRGNYQFIKTIGKGTFGKVYLAIHLPTREYVSIKILEKSCINDKEDLDRLQKEIKYLKIFNHPNIIQIYEVIENPKNYYIVMEYVSGGELYNYIVDNDKLTEKESSFFFTQIIYGIKEIHSKKICHRDIKPENLLLTEKKIIKIIDFGLSNEYNGLLKSQCGSPCYAAPEMIKGMKYDGLMVDLWSCGITLYAMLCGYLPFDDKDDKKIFKKIIKCDLEFPSEDEINLSNEVKDLISRILVANPLERIKIDEILKHPFLKSGIQEYQKIFLKNSLFDQEEIIIDFMVKKLKCSNKDNLIYKLIKENRHNKYTTTFKLLKKKIIEGRFDYNYNKNIESISPAKNIKVITENNKQNINNNLIAEKNKNKIKASLRRSEREDNLNENKVNRTHSTDSKKNTKINELSIKKDRNVIEDNTVLGIKNNDLLIKDLIKNKALYQELISKNKNINNFKREIDTSVSVDKNRQKKKKKIISKTPLRFMINPICIEKDILNYKNYYNKKFIYFPKKNSNKRNGLSADRINPKKVYYIPNPLLTQLFGGTNNMNLKLGKTKNKYILSQTPEIHNRTRYGLSADKANNKITKLKNKNNNININNYIYINNDFNSNEPLKNNIEKISQLNNNNITFISPNISKNINYKKINIYELENNNKNQKIFDKNIYNETIPLSTIPNNINFLDKNEQYKEIPYYNAIRNNNNKLNVNHIKNIKRKNDNYKYNITNNNITYNNFIYYQNYNYINDAINKERNYLYEINNNNMKIRKQINNYNINYIPISLRN